MEKLTEMKCEACRRGAPTVTEDEVGKLMPQIPNWERSESDGVQRLRRVYEFDDFADALAFTDEVGELAEEEGHHPALLTEWGKTTAQWWTKKIGGLHQNDFVMAAKTEEIYDAAAQRGDAKLV
ncbi:4a-hydroxytetrahydrobiopterin dehydratase [soil metagenome]